ncbi:MAG: glycosyltransferase family 4 protein [Lysobacteraceae bacterium]|nr:MAG: glycosyltransferase family 4 protein [Xanthomonadaceae bacterium]
MTFAPGWMLWFGLFLIVSALGTWLARHYALQRRMLDQPGERRSHTVATPRGGGISIAIALLIALCTLIVRMPSTFVTMSLAALGLVLVAGIGWIDDHRPLSVIPKLSVHILASLSLSAGIVLGGGSLGCGLVVFISGLVLINIWNFMDGIDGLAASQAGLAAVFFLLFAGAGNVVHLGLALVAAICGFLPFNLPTAKIFLGDVGSGALGYALALMAGLAMERMPVEIWPLLLLPLSAFLLDAGLTLLSRMLRGERWWTPHVEHAYQRWARRSRSHGRVTMAYAVWTMMAMAGGGLFGGNDSRGNAMLVLAWFGIGGASWYWLRSRPDSGHSDSGVKP